MRNIRQEIQEALRKIEKQEGVRILYAVESGKIGRASCRERV